MSRANPNLTTGIGEDATTTTTRLDDEVDTRDVGMAASLKYTDVPEPGVSGANRSGKAEEQNTEPEGESSSDAPSSPS